MHARLLPLLLLFALSIPSQARTYPEKMYIKADWDNDGRWVWHEMTTLADGVYSYEAFWRETFGVDIHVAPTDSGSLWFQYDTMVGYKPELLPYDQSVVYTYSEACERLYVSRSGEPAVDLILPSKYIHTRTPLTLTAFCHNLTSSSLSYFVTDPEGNRSAIGLGEGSVTIDTPGQYTFSVKAAGSDRNGLPAEAECAITCNVTDDPGPMPCPFTPTPDELSRCYHEHAESHDITFLLDPSLWGIPFASITRAHVGGSFNGWTGSEDDNYMMRPDPQRQIFYLTVPYNTVKRPDIIGQPEFKFVINRLFIDPHNAVPAQYHFTLKGKNEMLVFFSFDDIDAIRDEITTSLTSAKQLADFDLSKREDMEDISNYRTVPGTTMLKRCYHPFKGSTRSGIDTEWTRIDLVNRLAQADGVKADICLSGDQTGDLRTYACGDKVYTETIPDYYRGMIDNGNILYVGKGYETPSFDHVYYHSDSSTFRRWIGDIVKFITDSRQEGPFTIHCHIGTDRTGVMCAILAALCGASWEDVAADYKRSNRMAIGEYRSSKILQYALENMLGVTSIHDLPDFSAAITDYCVDNGTLTSDDVARLREVLNPTYSSIEQLPSPDSDTTARYYDLTGRPVSRPSVGLYIRLTPAGATKVIIR